MTDDRGKMLPRTANCEGTRLLPGFIILFLCLGLSGQSVADEKIVDDYFQVVFDTTESQEDGFEPGFGYGVYVQYDGVKLLFDTGTNSDTLGRNLRRAGVRLDELDAVAVSHNHPDHAGGLELIRTARPELAVYVPPAQAFDQGKLLRIDDQVALGANLYLLRTHTDQPTVGIADELSVLIRTADGPYLITACSHTGVATIVERARQVGGDDIAYYTGGARLKFRGEKDAHYVAGVLKQNRVAQVSPGHCSVDHGVSRVFANEFGSAHVPSRLGAKIPLRRPER